ncbi:MAG TPA: nuclear transport factor 2 family protein [Polyangiales bacterium]|nr:nuclear transport factor 2 family protein [Polyangiales bacterium]
MSKLRHGVRVLAAGGGALLLSACGASGSSGANGTSPLQLPERSNYRWVSAQCVDGTLDLARQGFERTLLLEQAGSGLRFTYETRLAQPACESTEIWSIQPDKASGLWQFVSDADVRLPPDAPCGAPVPVESGRGLVVAYGDTLEELRFSSPWCRGFDVRFIYHRVPAPALTQHELVRRYVAHWNRRDPRGVADLFASNGTLIEPFTFSSDGVPVRHEGRASIEAWLKQAFTSVSWLAIQLREIETLDERGQILALWRYYDPKLAEPLMGRNLFVLAGDEVFTTELQLLSEPVPAGEAPTSALPK